MSRSSRRSAERRATRSRWMVDDPSGLPRRWALSEPVRPRFGVQRLLATPSGTAPCADWRR